MTSFDIPSYYQAAQSGDAVDSTELLAYVKSFEHVVLWGASYLGRAIGERLLREGVRLDEYWDLRSEEIRFLHGVPVRQPLTGNHPTDRTLVVLCISNNLLKPVLSEALRSRGHHFLLGDYVYMGLVCPATKSSGADPETCMRSMCCRYIFCERLANIVCSPWTADERRAPDVPLTLFSATVVVNSICSLKCKFCTSYMHTYPASRRSNYPVERILTDVDRFFDAVDAVGTVTVMGGEPFLHPQLPDVVDAILGKRNCGLISISTSGTCPVRPDVWKRIRDPRVNVSFSNYSTCLNEKQAALFRENVEMAGALGVPHTVGVNMPQWIIPSTLYDRGMSAERMARKKADCVSPPRCIQLKNGKIHPCDFANAVHTLGIADYPSDYVEIDAAVANGGLRASLREFLDAPLYRVCGHCEPTGTCTSKAGEQGFHDFLTPAAN